MGMLKSTEEEEEEEIENVLSPMGGGGTERVLFPGPAVSQRQKPKSSSTAFLPQDAPPSAVIRPSGLSRRTSFRSQSQQQQDHPHGPVPHLAAIPARAPLVSPTAAADNLDKKKRGKKSSSSSVGFESLKSHGSTGSQGSTGSSGKASTASTSSSSSSNGVVRVGPAGSLVAPPMVGLLPEENVPDTEDPGEELNYSASKHKK